MSVYGSRINEKKWYLLFRLRNILDVIKGFGIRDESTFTSSFEINLALSLFYCFLKMHKQYVLDDKILHYFCLFEIYESRSLLEKELENACKRKQIPTDPRSVVKIYSCNDAGTDCIISNCHTCHSYDLAKMDVHLLILLLVK